MPVVSLRVRWHVFITAILIVAASTAVAQTNVTSVNGFATNHVPIATGQYTVEDVAVSPHAFLGNNTASSTAPTFVQPSAVDIDPAAETHGDSDYNIPSTKRTEGTDPAHPFTSSHQWCFPLAAQIPPGQTIAIVDAAGTVTPSNYLATCTQGSDTQSWNGLTYGELPKLKVAGSWAVAQSDGVSHWSVAVFQPPATSVTASTFLGLVRATHNGDKQCVWSSGSYHITGCSHKWTSAEVASIEACPTCWNVQIQFSDSSGNNTDLITHICGNTTSTTDCMSNGSAPGINGTAFDVYDAPNTTNGSAGNSLKVVTQITTVSGGGGDHVGLGVTECFDPGGTHGNVYQQVCGVPAEAGVTATGTAINNQGFGGGTTTWYGCKLNATWAKLPPTIAGSSENYALKGDIPTFSITTTANHATGVGVTHAGSIEALAYTYNGSGVYPNVPVSCPGPGAPLGVTIDLSLTVLQLQDSAGTDATGGLANTLDFSGWCDSTHPATTATSPPPGDHSANVKVQCSGSQALLYAGYDNNAPTLGTNSTMQKALAYLNSLMPEQRPRIIVDGVFAMTPIDPTNACPGGTCPSNAPIIEGMAYFEGMTPNSGFLLFADGSHYGEALPFLKTGRSGSDNNNGLTGTDANNPDQAGAGVVNMTFYGIPTGKRLATRSVSAIRNYGASGKMVFRDLRVVGMPGGLSTIGAYSGVGDISESTFWDIRSGNSGDPVSQTPAIDCGGIGSIAACNNVTYTRIRSAGDNFYTWMMRGCTNGGGSGGHIEVQEFKSESGAGDTYTNGGFGAAAINYPCVSPGGTGVSYPQADASGVLTGGTYGTTNYANGVGDVVFNGSLDNESLGTFGLEIFSVNSGDNSTVRSDDLHLSGGTGSGGGLLIEGCRAACRFRTPSVGTTDYGFVATGNFSSRSVIWDNDLNPQVPNIDASLTIYCNAGSGIIDPATGNCNTDLTRVTGALPCANSPAYSGGDVSSSGCNLNFANGKTGSGAVVEANSPTLVTPSLGVATATSISSGSYSSGGTVGVSCPTGINALTYRSVNGITTHC